MKPKLPKIKIVGFDLNFSRYKPKRIIKKVLSLGPKVRVSPILALYRKELRSLLFSPITYGITAIFLLVTYLLFFNLYGYASYSTSNLTNLFSSIALSYIVIIPTLTMSSISRERQNGNVEYLLTQPLTSMEYILAKAGSIASLVFVLNILTLPVIFSVSGLTQLDFGQICTQYVGSILLGFSFVAVGVSISSFFKSEIIAFISAFLLIIVLMTLGSQFLAFVPLGLQGALAKLSPLLHYQSLSRGVLDFSDVIYFLAVILVFLVIAKFSVSTWKYPSRHTMMIRLRASVTVTAVILLLTAYFGNLINFRIDLTATKRFTLTEETSKLLSKLPENLNLYLFTSPNLPFEYQTLKSELEYTLTDYEAIGKGKVRYIPYSIDNNNEEAVQFASGFQVGAQQLVSASADSASASIGYIGIGIEYGDAKTGFNINQANENLEFQLTASIKSLAKIDRPRVAVIGTAVSNSLSVNLTTLSEVLEPFFQLEELFVDEDTVSLDPELSAVIIPGPTSQFAENIPEVFRSFVRDGGSVFLMLEPVIGNTELPEPIINTDSYADIFEEFGLVANNDVMIDTESNQRINQGFFLVPVPYMPIVEVADQATEIMGTFRKATFFLPSSLNIDRTKGAFPILRTTSKGAAIVDFGVLNNTEELLRRPTSTKFLAGGYEHESGGRAVVIADAFAFTDTYLQEFLRGGPNASEIYNFVFSVLEWLSQPEISVSKIVGKTQPFSLIADAPENRNTIVWGSIIGSSSIILIGASLAYSIRYRTLKKKFEA